MSDGDLLQFVDTNVLIYAHDQSAGEKHNRARQLLIVWSEDLNPGQRYDQVIVSNPSAPAT